MIGNSIGDNNPAQAKRFFKITAIIAWAVFILIASCLIAFRAPITALFTDEPDVTALSIQTMPVVGIKHIFDGIQGYLQGVIRGLGLQKYGSVIALIVAYPIQIPLALWLAFTLNWGISGLWWADTFGMMIQGATFFLLITYSDWNEITRKALIRIKEENEALKQFELHENEAKQKMIK